MSSLRLKHVALALALVAGSASAFAGSRYFVVVPMPGRTAAPVAQEGADGPSLSSARLDFGTRQQGDIGLPIKLTLTNPGTTPLTLSRLTVPDASAAAGLSVQHDCATLAALDVLTA